MTPSPAVKDRLRAAIIEAPSPTRQRVRHRMAAVVAITVMLDAAIFAWARGSSGCQTTSRSTTSFGLALGGSLLIALLAAWRAFGHGGSMLGRSGRELAALTLATPLSLLAWVLVCAWLFPEAAQLPPRVGFRCFGLSFAFACWPVAWASVKRTWWCAPRLTGAARGVAIGAVGWVLLLGWCPRTGLSHLTVGHVAPLVLLALLGAWSSAQAT